MNSDQKNFLMNVLFWMVLVVVGVIIWKVSSRSSPSHEALTNAS